MELEKASETRERKKIQYSEVGASMSQDNFSSDVEKATKIH
jgi:hypothetical protein